MRSIIILLGTAVAITGCATPKAVTPTPAPYVSVPLADLDSGTELHVFGNHQSWGTSWDRTDSTNANNAPKLQRIDPTDTSGTYVAVFRNNQTKIDYGNATFVMPADGDTFTGRTSLGYVFEVTRSNDDLVYTLTGQYQVAYTDWLVPVRFAGGGFATGSSPADGDMPTSGTASYAGDFYGYSTIADAVTGAFEMDVNFASREMDGSLTNLRGAASEVISDVELLATLTSEGSDFTGVANVDGTGRGADFPFGTVGDIEGGFFGPNGEEIGGTIRIKANGEYLTGSFGGN